MSIGLHYSVDPQEAIEGIAALVREFHASSPHLSLPKAAYGLGQLQPKATVIVRHMPVTATFGQVSYVEVFELVMRAVFPSQHAR